MKRMKFIISLVGFLMLFVGCATTYMKVPVTKPARINLVGIKKIAIGEITGTGSADFADELTTRLFNSNRYEVLDRQNLDRIFQEHKLSYTGAIDENTAAELGKFIGSAALVFGRVSQNRYTEEMSTNDWKEQKTGKNHRTYTREGKANVAVTLQVTDLRTGKIIAVRNLPMEVTKSTRATDETPDKIDQAALLRDARSRILTTFMKDIAPYTELERVALVSDKEIPQLKMGIGMAKAGNWGKAVEYFQKACNSNPASSKAFFDLGVAQMWSYNFDEAEKAFEKAYSLEPKSSYIKDITRCKQLKAEQEKLKEQMKQAGI
jgi:tetratricopeptide (TPR) repeat protein